MITIINTKKEKLISVQAGYECLKRNNCLPSKKEVFIKPNIGATSKIANTDPELVKGMIRYLKDKGFSNITIGEGSVETEYESTPYNFHYCGWDVLVKDEDVTLVDLNRVERVEISWKYGMLKIPKVMTGKSYINVAKMKTHMQTGVSLCAKNQKGLLDSSTRKLFHRLGLHEPIAELAKVITPELCVVDGIVALEGNGPGDLSTPRNLGIVVCGNDMLEVDWSCCRIMGVDPYNVKHLCRMFVDSGAKDWEKPPCITNHPFVLPQEEIKMFNVHIRPENACSACLSGVGKLNKLARKSMCGIKFFTKHGILNRLDIVVGSPKDVPKNHGDIIFYGDCSAEVANKYPEYPFFGGCPPISKKVLEELTE